MDIGEPIGGENHSPSDKVTVYTINISNRMGSIAAISQKLKARSDQSAPRMAIESQPQIKWRKNRMKAFACDSEIFPLVDAEMQRDFLNKDFETKDKPYAIYCDNQDQSFGVSFANYEIMVEIGCEPGQISDENLGSICILLG
jgi:hypothetical protein